MTHLLAIGMPGPFEWIIIAGLALLVFGKRLPDVGRNMALGIRGFQQGLKSPPGGDDDDDDDDDRKSLPNNK